MKSGWADGSWDRGHRTSGVLGPSLALGALKERVRSRLKLINITTYSNLNFQIQSLFLTSWDLIHPSSARRRRSSRQAASRTVNAQGGSARQSCGQSGGQTLRSGPIPQLVQPAVTTTASHRIAAPAVLSHRRGGSGVWQLVRLVLRSKRRGEFTERQIPLPGAVRSARSRA